MVGRRPCIEINLEKIKNNANCLVKYCGEKGIEIMGITKGVCAHLPVVRAMLDGGIKKLGDSRIQNIMALRKAGIKNPIYQIRIPMISEAKDVVFYADGSLNSEIEVIKALSGEAKKLGRVHKIILMVDVGDLREGVMPEDAVSVVGEILKLDGVEFEGLGTNVGCYGGILPSYENTKILVDLAKEIEKKYGIEVKTISGGNTATISLLEKGRLPEGVNQLRVGEGILLGTDVTNSRKAPGTVENTMTLKTEVIEVKVKPSYPIGEIGRDAFGNIPVFEDKGPMRRAIVALGKQDCRIEGLKPVDPRIEILGASSDHMILDVTRCPEVEVGDVIEFSMDYGAMLSLMTSSYVEKVI